MAIGRDDRKKLKKMLTKLPRAPTVHDLSLLDPVQARRYREHRARLADWKILHPNPGDEGGGMIGARGFENYPELPEDLRFILEGPRRTVPEELQITEDDTTESAAEKYRRALEYYSKM